MTTAIFPGTFDPFTRGHEAVVAQALSLFERVVIGIGDNCSKKSLLTAGARCRLVSDLYASEPRVEARIYSGLTGDFAAAEGAAAIIRGVRSVVDFEYERSMASVNRRLFPSLSTVILFTPAEVADISSSVVRELLLFGRRADEFLPEGVELEKYLKMK